MKVIAVSSLTDLQEAGLGRVDVLYLFAGNYYEYSEGGVFIKSSQYAAPKVSFAAAQPVALSSLQERQNNHDDYIIELQQQITGVSSAALLKANNLSDLNDAAIARTNIGLGNVDNTSDADKPVSTAQQAALDNLETTISNYHTSFTISPPDTLNLLSAPYNTGIPVPGGGKAIVVTSAEVRMEYASAPYDYTKLGLSTIPASFDNCQMVTQPYMGTLGSIFTQFQNIGNLSVVVENRELYLMADADSSVGDSPFKVYITYKIVTL